MPAPPPVFVRILRPPGRSVSWFLTPLASWPLPTTTAETAGQGCARLPGDTLVSAQEGFDSLGVHLPEAADAARSEARRVQRLAIATVDEADTGQGAYGHRP